MGRKIRIGIDVGGTFTDAIALDNETYEIIGMKKVHTTHSAEEGVTRGVIDILNQLLNEIQCNAQDVVFIAHGTTQATNALLEGDVADIGIIGMGKGVGAAKAKADTNIGDIRLEDGKAIHTQFAFLNTSEGVNREELEQALKRMKQEGISVVVLSEAFSVDDPANEQKAAGIAEEYGMIATPAYELTKLYGLRARTKTAVINASILPKMMQTADLTGNAVKDARIRAPLMIMRSDGGVMQVEEVKRRPILTVLSGPAAGVAGALMYEKISDGIFLEVGGTSTDISAVQNGRVLTKYAKIGGHSTYVSSLDIHTVGIGGGSMIRWQKERILDVGPRSSHIAGLPYACFATAEELKGGRLVSVGTPKDKSCDFMAVETKTGVRYAVTLTCTANYLGLVPEGDYARADSESARIVFEIAEKEMGRPAKEIAADIMAAAVKKVAVAVDEFIKEYHLSRSYLILTGGGGGASAVVPAVAEKMRLKFKVAKNAPVISTIGAALAMVRDSVERTIVNPTQEDIMSIRNEAEQAAIRSGAAPGQIEVTVDIDTAKNTVRAVAVGTTDLSVASTPGQRMTEEQLKEQIKQAFLGKDRCQVEELYHSSTLHAYEVKSEKRGPLFFLKKKSKTVCVIDQSGVIRLNVEDADGYVIKAGDKDRLRLQIEGHMKFDESGKNTPVVHLAVGGKISDLSGLDSTEQIMSLAELELSRLKSDEAFLALIKKR